MDYTLPLNVNGNGEPVLDTSNIFGWLFDWDTEIEPYLKKLSPDGKMFIYEFNYPCRYFEEPPKGWRFMSKNNGPDYVQYYLTYHNTSFEGIRAITDTEIEEVKQFAKRVFGITREIKLFPAIEWLPNDSDSE